MELESATLAAAARDRGQQQSAYIRDTSCAYWFYPAIAKPKGILVMIHGYRGNHHGLEAIAGALKDLDIYIPDLPGFGKSAPLKGEHSIEGYASWLQSFIEALNLKSKPHLLGHSFGSIVVSRYAAGSAAIKTLILENPVSAPALKGPKAIMTRLALLFFWLAENLPRSAGEWVLKSWPMVRGMSIVMTKSNNRKLRKWVHQQHDQNFNDFANRRVALEGYNASISNFVAEFAPFFAVPTLVIAGERDDITTVAAQRQMFSMIDQPGSLVVIPKVGHLTHYESPKRVAQEIEQWIEIND